MVFLLPELFEICTGIVLGSATPNISLEFMETFPSRLGIEEMSNTLSLEVVEISKAGLSG